MAPAEVQLNICTRFVDQNYDVSGENMCGKCCKMKAHVELLISELKSSHLIINILQEEIKLTSTRLRNQDNLTNCAEYKSHDELHSTNEKRQAWMEIRRIRATAVKHKRYNHTSNGYRHIPAIIESIRPFVYSFGR
jgi:hypothetical protein